jgi:hypothetical protein
VGGIGRFEEDTLQVCQGFSCTDNHVATPLSVHRQMAPERTAPLYDACVRRLEVFFVTHALPPYP